MDLNPDFLRVAWVFFSLGAFMVFVYLVTRRGQRGENRDKGVGQPSKLAPGE